MLGLTLRKEFLSSQMPGTQIDLDEVVHTRTADAMLSITYPTADVRNTLRAVAEGDGRPIVIVGERGRGKSHILGVVHFGFTFPDVVERWATDWSTKFPELSGLALPRGFRAISAAMSNHDYVTLWEPIFKWLTDGSRYRGRFEEAKTPVPSRSLLEEAFAAEPTALILDELQTWFESLSRDPAGGSPRDLAFNFIQILSELASDRPDIFKLIVSVRNSGTDAYRQIHRNNPLLVDFKGVEARKDRVHLIQHRLFENHLQIARNEIESSTASYANERLRLLHPNAAGPAADERAKEVIDTWPFAPELIDLLEDEFLMAEAAQETRDLMKVLVHMFKAEGATVPLLTVADVDVADGNGSGGELASMVDVLKGGGTRLRDVALRNLESIKEQGVPIPHASELISALWVRSMSPGPRPGATPSELHLDITRSVAMDDNSFDEELEKLKVASFNIHPEGERLIFKIDENPRAKLLASARNDKLFQSGQDLEYIQRAIAQALSPMDLATTVISKLIVMNSAWESDPWTGRPADELPSAWREPVVVVVPENLTEERLARWLNERVAVRRNLVHFLMPSAGTKSPFEDDEIRVLARCAYLAEDWSKTDSQYTPLRSDFQKQLRDKLSRWFERVAVLTHWDFGEPARTKFVIDSVGGGPGVLKAIEDHISKAIFDVDLFRDYVKREAALQKTAYDVIGALTEPPATPDEVAIPFLGESALYERILLMVASGEIAVNVKGTWMQREATDASTEFALQRIRPKAFATRQYLQEITLAPKAAAPAAPHVPSPPAAVQAGVGTPSTSGHMVQDASQPGLPTVRTLKSSGPRSSVNLLGDIHGWSIADTAVLQDVRLSAQGITAATLRDLLKRMPPALQITLEVDVPE